MSELPKFLPADAQCIGHVAVDSGTVHVGDPCYLIGWTQKRGKIHSEVWNEYCEPMTDAEQSNADNDSVIEPIGDKAGLHISTAHGDGVYPVYAALNEVGRPKWVLIDLFGEEDE